jgi:hypothetical protein
VTTLPDSVVLRDVFGRIDELLTEYASAAREPGKSNVLAAAARFK